MNFRMRHVIAPALIAVGVTAAASFAQQAGPSDEPTPPQSARARSEAKHDGCGGGRKAPGPAQLRHRRAHPGTRVVHGEVKVQRGDGFALRVLDAGRVTAVDAGAKTLTIERADDETVTVTATNQTRICKDGQPATFGDIETGDLARINRVTAEGTTIVRGIRVHSPEAAEGEPASLSVPA